MTATLLAIERGGIAMLTRQPLRARLMLSEIGLLSCSPAMRTMFRSHLRLRQARLEPGFRPKRQAPRQSSSGITGARQKGRARQAENCQIS